MAKEGVTLDTVTIRIESDASKSTAGLDRLSASLANLKSAISGGFANINKLANGLANLKTSSEGLSDVAKNLEPLSKIGDALKPLSDIKATGFNKVINSLDRIPTAMNNITPNAIENVARVSNELATALTPLASKLESIGQGYSAISKLADKYGVSVTKVRDKSQSTVSVMTRLKNALSKLSTPFRKLRDSSSDFGKVATKHFEKMNSKIKQIGLSLLGTRTIFTATRKAVSEYMAMDTQLADSLSNVWRAFGAQLAPAVEQVIYLFKQFVRVIYSVIKAITGIDLIARANEKAMGGWGKSAKDLLGSLQKFDDLNVVEFNQSGSGDENKLIDLTEIDLTPIQKIVDWVKKLKQQIKEALDTGKWYNVGVVFAEGMNQAFSAIDFDYISEKLNNVATQFGEFLNGIIENTNWEIVGEKISGLFETLYNTLNNFVSSINFEAVGKGISDFFKGFDLTGLSESIGNLIVSLAGAFSDMFVNIDWGMVATKLSEATIVFIEKMNQALMTIDWSQIGISIRTAIENIDWLGLINSILDLIKNAMSSAGSLLDGVFGTDMFSTMADSVNSLINNIMLIGTTIGETLGEGTAAGNILADVESIFDTIFGLVGDIGDDLTQWIISDEFQDVITVISEILSDIFDFVNDIFKKVSDWWNGEGGSIVRSILSELTKIVKDVLEVIKPILKGIWDALSWAWDTILEPVITFLLKKLDILLTVFRGITDFVKKIFAGDIKGAFASIKDTVATVTDKMKSLWRSVINAILGFVENFVNWFIRAINKIIKAYNGSLGKFFEWLGMDVKISEIKEVSLSRLATGTNKIPEDGPYYLHKNEAVVPKKYNPAVGGGNNEELLSRVDRLIFLAENQEQTTVVNVGNETLYKAQKSYNKMQNNKYGTINV